MHRICYVNNLADGLFIFAAEKDVYRLFTITLCKHCIVMYSCNGYVKHRLAKFSRKTLSSLHLFLWKIKVKKLK